jgi:hypothetical protein
MTPPPDRPLSRRRFAAALLGLGLGAVGCGYSIRPPYDRSVRTVYLPVFQSQRFRRDLGIQLTEMLRQEIQERTPYRVVANPEDADARLEGVVTFDDKNVMVENPFNLQRQVLATLAVNVAFTDNRTGQVRERTIPSTIVIESASFYPEIGESATAGFHKAMKRIVRDIVSMMEEPWGEEYLVPDEPPEEPIIGRAPSGDASEPESARVVRREESAETMVPPPELQITR